MPQTGQSGPREADETRAVPGRCIGGKERDRLPMAGNHEGSPWFDSFEPERRSGYSEAAEFAHAGTAIASVLATMPMARVDS